MKVQVNERSLNLIRNKSRGVCVGGGGGEEQKLQRRNGIFRLTVKKLVVLYDANVVYLIFRIVWCSNNSCTNIKRKTDALLNKTTKIAGNIIKIKQPTN